MYFAFQSFLVKEKAAEFGNGIKCPHGALCDFRCNSQAIELRANDVVIFKSEKYNIEDFINRLQNANLVCDTHFINIYSEKGITHGKVLALSDRLNFLFPNAQISWGNKDN
ncbi:hypothetical protein [Planctobacterium marinum]|uniref:Uncharacterized protein n=1 Tax=Planctobacterium marinum TaxID=1631968 RepID=A0AA48HZJ3_9ALTE|nr:hypothetical protein MACH26_30310 [Planctobacterium marinum]